MYKSRTAHRALITCNMPYATRYEGTTQLLSLTEFESFILDLFYWLKPLPDEGEEET